MDARFNQMLGFSEEEVRQMIRYYKEVGAIGEDKTEDDIIADMKPWYLFNYVFADDSFGVEPSMFNCDMVCYYMSQLVDTGKRPKVMVDPNTMTDYGKLETAHRNRQHGGEPTPASSTRSQKRLYPRYPCQPFSC